MGKEQGFLERIKSKEKQSIFRLTNELLFPLLDRLTKEICRHLNDKKSLIFGVFLVFFEGNLKNY